MYARQLYYYMLIEWLSMIEMNCELEALLWKPQAICNQKNFSYEIHIFLLLSLLSWKYFSELTKSVCLSTFELMSGLAKCMKNIFARN